jgi:hypothetical protein
VNARDLLAAACALVDAPPPDTVGIWPRAAALLARQAIEQRLAIALSARGADPYEASFAVQLLVLPEVVDARVAERAAWAWAGLSSATHHHGYEIPPSADELRGWLAATQELIDATE